MDDTSESKGDQLPANRAAHLARFQFRKGQSGNPGGRPKGRTLMGVLRELLDGEQLDRGDGTALKCPDGERVIDLVARAYLWKCIRKGDPKLLVELLDRTDGKVQAKLEVDGELTIKVEYADDFAPVAEAAPGATGDPEGGETV